jgi:3-phosphoshikimate 1-carboxyvinyltransferase
MGPRVIEDAAPIKPYRTQRARPLRGLVTLPGDPVLAARALLVAAMARGESRFDNVPTAAAVTAMADAVSALGARADLNGSVATVSGMGVGGFLEPFEAIDAGALGDAAALLFGATGIYPFETRFAGVGRPAPTIVQPLDELGIRIDWNADRPGPLTFRGPVTPVPGPFTAATEGAKSALLLAAAAIPGTTEVSEPFASLDHTERLLAAFGARIATRADAESGAVVEVQGLADLAARSFEIPGDPAFAAATLVAGLVVPGAEIEIANALLNPWRASLLELMVAMGGDLRVTEQTVSGGEEVGRLSVRHGALSGIEVPGPRTALLGDELPMLILAACFARGDTVIEGALGAETETGWLDALLRGLTANGAAWEWAGEALVIHGQGRVRGGGRIPAHPDPRIALVFLIMGMATRDPMRVEEGGGIEGRFAGLLDAFTALGATFRRDS